MKIRSLAGFCEHIIFGAIGFHYCYLGRDEDGAVYQGLAHFASYTDEKFVLVLFSL